MKFELRQPESMGGYFLVKRPSCQIAGRALVRKGHPEDPSLPAPGDVFTWDDEDEDDAEGIMFGKHLSCARVDVGTFDASAPFVPEGSS